MVEIDSRLKGIILSHALMSYKITPIESANVLKVTMKFYGIARTRAQANGGETSAGGQSFWPSLGGTLS